MERPGMASSAEPRARGREAMKPPSVGRQRTRSPRSAIRRASDIAGDPGTVWIRTHLSNAPHPPLWRCGEWTKV